VWIFLSDAMLWIVAHPERDDLLTVRARCSGDIEHVFPGVRVTVSPDRDYRFRAAVPRDEVAAVIAEAARGIDYGNFKASVPERDRHDAYLRAWAAMADLQDRRHPPRRPPEGWWMPPRRRRRKAAGA
jgi:hypothetical protein